MRACISIRCWPLFLGAAVLLAMPIVTRGQDQLAAKDDLKKAFDENYQRRDQLFNGDDTAKKGDEKIAKAAAQWYIYRVTIKSNKPGELEAVHTDFSKRVAELMDSNRRSKTQAFREMFGKELVSSMKDVFVRDIKADPSTVTHAAMMLPTMAKLRQDDVSNYLIALVNDKTKHDVIRLNALKALKETMPVVEQDSVDNLVIKGPDFWAKAARESKNVDALAQIIDRKINGLTPQEEAVTRFIRREAIISLAKAGSPAVLAYPAKYVKKAEPLQGLVAPTLLRVMANNRMEPAASTQERIEAAHGLCAMKYKEMPEYRPELANYLIGYLLLDMVKEYNTDWGNFAALGPKKQLPRIGWKTEAQNLKASLLLLKENAKAGSGAKGAADLEEKARPILEKMMRYEQPAAADVEELLRVNRLARPKDDPAYVFQTKTAPIPLPAKK